MLKIPVLGYNTQDFPPIEHALNDPNGLLAAGGDLSPQRLLQAYSLGIFPWYEKDQPILWWSPNPRAVLFPEEIHISKSLRKTLRRKLFQVTMDTAFENVVNACAEPRTYSEGTWITQEMKLAYIELHRLGYAHSVEVWQNGNLVGGLYGVALGRLFFGESMFSRADNASKVAFVHLAGQLAEWRFPLIDCQVANPHLDSLGSVAISRDQFKNFLQEWLPNDSPTLPVFEPWRLDWQYGV